MEHISKYKLIETELASKRESSETNNVLKLTKLKSEIEKEEESVATVVKRIQEQKGISSILHQFIIF